jgi:phosphohistidine phosphatase
VPGGSPLSKESESRLAREQTDEMTSQRRLILLRHAKSSWDDASLPDNERPLAPRGRRALVLVQQHLRVSDADVDVVLCSPARRTRETWDGVRAAFRPATEVRFVREIYEATANELLDVVRDVDDRYAGVLVIGHNPGMEQLANGLVFAGKRKALDRLGHGFPTAALATLSVDVAWAELDWRAARLEHYVRPRDLSRD